MRLAPGAALGFQIERNLQMSTATTTSNTTMQHLIDQRLDALDHALLGLVPRHDRLALVAQAENRIREHAAANLTAMASFQASAVGATPGDWAQSGLPAGTATFAPLKPLMVPASGGMAASPGKRRSRLALSAGVLGIAALVLLFGTPVTYVFVATVGELFGEIVSISLIGAHLMAVAIGGMTAVGLGIAALVSLRRRKGNLDGRGWAIAGLCAGPVPMLVGGLALVVGGWQLLEVQDFFGEPVSAYAAPDAAMPPTSDNSAPDDSDATLSSALPPDVVIRVAGARSVDEPTACAAPCESPDRSLECDLPAATFDHTGPEPVGPLSTPPESLRAVQ
jgi:hypothetical protein